MRDIKKLEGKTPKNILKQKKRREETMREKEEEGEAAQPLNRGG